MVKPLVFDGRINVARRIASMMSRINAINPMVTIMTRLVDIFMISEASLLLESTGSVENGLIESTAEMAEEAYKTLYQKLCTTTNVHGLPVHSSLDCQLQLNLH
jgi:hypothetical protein